MVVRALLPEAVGISDLDKKLLRSSSLVSAPVFLDFGEPTGKDEVSFKDGAAPILSA